MRALGGDWFALMRCILHATCLRCETNEASGVPEEIKSVGKADNEAWKQQNKTKVKY